jgi:hypothetical protein
MTVPSAQGAKAQSYDVQFIAGGTKVIHRHHPTSVEKLADTCHLQKGSEVQCFPGCPCCMMFALRYLWSRLRLRLSSLVRWHLAASRPRSTIRPTTNDRATPSGSLCFGHQCRISAGNPTADPCEEWPCIPSGLCYSSYLPRLLSEKLRGPK